MDSVKTWPRFCASLARCAACATRSRQPPSHAHIRLGSGLQAQQDRGAPPPAAGRREDGKTALFIPCDKGHLGLVNFLLAATSGKDGCTRPRRHEVLRCLHMQLKNIGRCLASATRSASRLRVKFVDVTGTRRNAEVPAVTGDELSRGGQGRDRGTQRTKRVAAKRILEDVMRLDSDVANNGARPFAAVLDDVVATRAKLSLGVVSTSRLLSLSIYSLPPFASSSLICFIMFIRYRRRPSAEHRGSIVLVQLLQDLVRDSFASA